MVVIACGSVSRVGREPLALVYDILFSWDADMNPQPQMVESWTVSEDKLLYTFVLRPGLKFHDGSALTTRDVVATLKRLFVRDSQIQSLASRVEVSGETVFFYTQDAKPLLDAFGIDVDSRR